MERNESACRGMTGRNWRIVYPCERGMRVLCVCEGRFFFNILEVAATASRGPQLFILFMPLLFFQHYLLLSSVLAPVACRR